MKKLTLTDSLKRLNSRPLNEFAGTGSPAGAAMDQRPDMSGFRGNGAKINFDPRNDAGPEWPYEDDGYMAYGQTMGNKGRDRGDRGGEDVSGGPPTPKLQSTWEGGPDEVEEGADYDEQQRHGDDKYRNVWRDTPDGKDWTKLNNESAWSVVEGMGSPGRVGPFAPMDGPSHGMGRDAGPVEDENGDPITPQQLPTKYKDMSGPGNMWGGAGTVPGATGGWANAPYRPEDDQDPRKNPMKLKEFFSPAPVPVEEVENPDPRHDHDQSDEDVESQIDANFGSQDNDEEGEELMGPPGPGLEDMDDMMGDHDDMGPPGFTGRLGGMSLNVLPRPGAAGEFVSSPDKLGAARGTFGLHTDGSQPNDVVDKSSAWDVLQKVVSALNSNNNGEEI